MIPFALLPLAVLGSVASPSGRIEVNAQLQPRASERTETVTVILAEKAITCSEQGAQSIDNVAMVIKGSRIARIGKAVDIEIPDGAKVIDYGDRWIVPGFIDLHSHVGGSRGDINDMVYQLNSELRIGPAVICNNDGLQRPLAAGVTTILFIPGSGTNIGGQGVMMKLGLDEYEEAVIRDPGSLKIAQGDNPTRWGYGMSRILMNWGLRYRLRRGQAYSKAWDAYEAGDGPKPQRELALDIFRELYAGRTQISTHTQYYQLVLMTITMLARDFELPTYIDHGSFDSYKTAPIAEKYGVAAILGPREIMVPRPPRFDTDGRIEGSAWGFQENGNVPIGFNTDAPVVPQEELTMQAAMGVRYGMHNDIGQGLRGVTMVPATVSGMSHRVGSLEAGKDADFVVVSGDPIDPRTSFEATWVNGRHVYEASRDGRAW